MKKIFCIAALCAVAVSAMALPARREGVIRTAEDGTEKIVYLHGDAFCHYMTDAEGNWLDEQTLLPMTAEQKEARVAHHTARANMRREQQVRKVGGKINLAPRGLIILVNFKDLSFKTPYDTIHEMLNGDNFTRSYDVEYTYGTQTYRGHVDASGSAKQYFHDQSWGQYNPQFDVVGPVTLNQNYSHYGKNNSQGDDQNVDAMVREACNAVNSEVDFTLYDNDQDGKVDFVYFIYAGFGEADGGEENTIWPHNYDYQYYVAYGSPQLTVDGKKISNYACSNELQYLGGEYAGIGTFCHEFSHVLGLPDLYVTVNMSNPPHTPSDWSILDYGPYLNEGNTPPAYSAYERFFMGWITPRVLDEPEGVWLHPLNTSKEALILCEGNTHNLDGFNPNPKQFYILECRTQTGWDKYLPGKGMLITKINYNATKWADNTVNNSRNSMGVDIIEAKTNTSKYGLSTDAFPAGAKSWYGFDDHEIEDIKLQRDGTVTFSYRGGYVVEAIEDVQSDPIQSTKVLRDGQLIIVRGGVMYDPLGRTIDR